LSISTYFLQNFLIIVLEHEKVKRERLYIEPITKEIRESKEKNTNIGASNNQAATNTQKLFLSIIVIID